MPLVLALQNDFRVLLVVPLWQTSSNKASLKERMKKIPEWELEKKHIERTFEFDDFADAIDFVNAVAEVAEEEEHHPDIDIRYNKVRLVLSTHSKGGLTELDFGLAERIDTLAEVIVVGTAGRRASARRRGYRLSNVTFWQASFVSINKLERCLNVRSVGTSRLPFCGALIFEKLRRSSRACA